jgi:hypothetical protein
LPGLPGYTRFHDLWGFYFDYLLRFGSFRDRSIDGLLGWIILRLLKIELPVLFGGTGLDNGRRLHLSLLLRRRVAGGRTDGWSSDLWRRRLFRRSGFEGRRRRRTVVDDSLEFCDSVFDAHRFIVALHC